MSLRTVVLRKLRVLNTGASRPRWIPLRAYSTANSAHTNLGIEESELERLEAERLHLPDDGTWDEEDILGVFKRLKHYLPAESAEYDPKAHAAAEIPNLLKEIGRQKKWVQDDKSWHASGFEDVRDYRSLPKIIRPDSIVFIEASDKYLTDDEFIRTIPSGAKSFIRMYPCRTVDTCKRTGKYCLIFPRRTAARSWLQHVFGANLRHEEYLQGKRYSTLHHPVLGHILPRHARKITSYLKTLGRIMTCGESTIDQKESGGFGDFLAEVEARGRIADQTVVSFNVHGLERLNFKDLVQCILIDGLDRNRLWGVRMLNQKLGVSKAADSGKLALNIVGAILEASELSYRQDSTSSILLHRPERVSPTCWLLSFTTPDEARIFARSWNGKRFPIRTQSKVGGANGQTIRWEWPTPLLADGIVVSTDVL